MTDVTRILSKIESGDPQASEELLPLVYDELRRLARARMTAERPNHTLQATALVHEAYVRLVRSDDEVCWESRGHFFAAAAEAMRRILVDSAREKKSLKRGGDLQRLDLAEDLSQTIGETSTDLLDFNEALKVLEEQDPQAAELVKLRIFAGLSNREAGDLLGLPTTTAHRCWRFARAWFTQRLENASDEDR